MNTLFTIEPKSLSSIDFLINVPVYQRPYCWEKEQVEKLLNDFKDNIREETYFIGNIISIKNFNSYDLIDGQQRLTTLWIICLYFSKYNPNILTFCKVNNNSRLSFSIRKTTNNYLNNLLNQKLDQEGYWIINRYLPSKELEENNDSSLEQNHYIASVFRIIDQWVKDNLTEDSSIQEFSNFVYNKVSFQFLVAPANTDENKLFIQINTNGTQFQHYDILKAELLNCLSENDKTKYAEIWEKAAFPYFIRSLKDNDNNTISKSVNNKSIKDLVDLAHPLSFNKQQKQTNTIQSPNYQYITYFNTLLIHTLFIYCKKQKLPLPSSFNLERLLEIFKEFRKSISSTEPDRESIGVEFLDTLSKVRKIIDTNFIFKDLRQNEFNLLPTQIEQNQDSDFDDLHDTQEDTNIDRQSLEQLQRMLYHNNNDNKHFWLGIFLDQYIINGNPSIDQLEKIDNILSLSERSLSAYTKYFQDTEDFLNHKETLSISELPLKFTEINRYWFYKIEYLLWKQTHKNDYYIVSRTSKEHILPQSQKDYYKMNGIDIDDFGNLILITTSENSGFSNKNLLEKFEYQKKLKNPPLKMIHFYETLEKIN